jgi:type I restriction enzyme S subunit
LRFPGFEEEWENNILGGICKMQAGKFVSSSEIHNESQDELFACYGGNGLRGYTKSNNQNGLYSLIGRQGALCGNITLVDGKFHATEHAVIVTPKDGTDTLMLHYLLKHLNLNQYATGAAQPGLSVQNMEKLEVKIPKSKTEQQKIALLLSQMDQRIQTQNKILEQLETLIKAVSKKIFIQQLRFKGTHDQDYADWESKNIGDVLTIGSGKDYKHLGKGDIPVFGTGGLMTYVNSFLFDGETVCIGRKGTIDAPRYHNGKIWTVDTLFFTHSFLNCLPKYIFYFFGTINWLMYNEASGVPSLSKNTIEKIPIVVPCIEEQLQIIKFLSSIEEKIFIEQEILNIYQDQKKCLLRNMFI